MLSTGTQELGSNTSGKNFSHLRELSRVLRLDLRHLFCSVGQAGSLLTLHCREAEVKMGIVEICVSNSSMGSSCRSGPMPEIPCTILGQSQLSMLFVKYHMNTSVFSEEILFITHNYGKWKGFVTTSVIFR